MDKHGHLPQILALKEAAQYLNIGAMTLYRMAQRGEIPAFRVGCGWRFSVEALDRWRFSRDPRGDLVDKWRH